MAVIIRDLHGSFSYFLSSNFLVTDWCVLPWVLWGHGILMAPRTWSINMLGLAHLLLCTCLLPIVREILCDRGESAWTLLGRWWWWGGASVHSEASHFLLSRKRSLSCKRNSSSCFPSNNLSARTLSTSLPDEAIHAQVILASGFKLGNVGGKPGTPSARFRWGV